MNTRAAWTRIVALAVLAAGAAVWAQERRPATPTPAGIRGAKEHIFFVAGQEKWQKGPDALPGGAKMQVIEGDPKAGGALFTMRLHLPAGYRVPPHHHLTDEHVTVIKGILHLGMGERIDEAGAKTLPAGSFVVMPRGENHFAFARDETIIQIHALGPWGIVYVNPDDDPRRGKR